MNMMNQDIDHVLVSEEQLQAKVAELGVAISRDYAGKDLCWCPSSRGRLSLWLT